jgi:dihydroxyacetone kinase
MTRLFNDPTDFADELTDGFVAAHRRWVLRVPGGVIRSTRSTRPTVAVITGGGSGHYPAFAGYVGQGIAHGAAMGNLFASPSAQQVHSVATAAERGAGVLFCYGNYAGDVLHFDQAQERLNGEGVRARTVTVTDDISSAPLEEIGKRRGVAGDVPVLKTAGAAAEAGYDLDQVVEVAQRANNRTRTYGVAFSGCTLPGASAPLFEVPAGRMALGLGIHGEPGIGETDVPSADELARDLVDRLLAEVPDDIARVEGARVAVILNGLGTIKYEELFVVYSSVARLLDAAGVQIIEPEVGELVTSFDMAGLSLTLFWLDDELERLWAAPADTPAFRKGNVAADETIDAGAVAVAETVIGAASDQSRAAAGRVVTALAATRDVVDANADELGRIDAVAGDGDHGIGMQRGATAAASAATAALDRGAGAGTVLAHAGDAWADRAGGTSGAIWGLILRTLADDFGDTDVPQPRTVAAAVRNAARAVMDFGKASLGDKTLVDVLVPFGEALDRAASAGDPLPAAWSGAADVATKAARDTADLVPLIGRARPHAERSLGTPDAGAVSLALIVNAVAEVLRADDERRDRTPGE